MLPTSVRAAYVLRCDSCGWTEHHEKKSEETVLREAVEGVAALKRVVESAKNWELVEASISLGYRML